MKRSFFSPSLSKNIFRVPIRSRSVKPLSHTTPAHLRKAQSQHLHSGDIKDVKDLDCTATKTVHGVKFPATLYPKLAIAPDNAWCIFTGHECCHYACMIAWRTVWLCTVKQKRKKKKKNYAFWHQYNEKPSIIPGCPGNRQASDSCNQRACCTSC